MLTVTECGYRYIEIHESLTPWVCIISFFLNYKFKTKKFPFGISLLSNLTG